MYNEIEIKKTVAINGNTSIKLPNESRKIDNQVNGSEAQHFNYYTFDYNFNDFWLMTDDDEITGKKLKIHSVKTSISATDRFTFYLFLVFFSPSLPTLSIPFTAKINYRENYAAWYSWGLEWMYGVGALFKLTFKKFGTLYKMFYLFSNVLFMHWNWDLSTKLNFWIQHFILKYFYWTMCL